MLANNEANDRLTSMEEIFLRQIEQHKALIFKVCHTFRGADAEAQRDLFQDIVAELWRAFPRFNGSVKWTTWAYRIALNVAITQQRRKRIATVEWSDAAAGAVQHPAETDEQLAALNQAIATLNEAEKALILLYLDDLSYADIADITGLSENHVGVKINRIKNKLKSLLLHGKR